MSQEETLPSGTRILIVMEQHQEREKHMKGTWSWSANVDLVTRGMFDTSALSCVNPAELSDSAVHSVNMMKAPINRGRPVRLLATSNQQPSIFAAP